MGGGGTLTYWEVTPERPCNAAFSDSVAVAVGVVAMGGFLTVTIGATGPFFADPGLRPWERALRLDCLVVVRGNRSFGVTVRHERSAFRISCGSGDVKQNERCGLNS